MVGHELLGPSKIVAILKAGYGRAKEIPKKCGKDEEETKDPNEDEERLRRPQVSEGSRSEYGLKCA